MKKSILITSIIFVLAISTFVLYKNTSSTQGTGIIEIPLSEITKEANWYEYPIGNNKIRFFAVRASDGSIKTAFDACDVCFNSKKGYRQEGDFMICNNCGNRYPISGLGTESKAGGGCWPSYLSSKINGENLIIEISDLNKGARLFS